jgi:hypothetical protein
MYIGGTLFYMPILCVINSDMQEILLLGSENFIESEGKH